MFTLIFFSNLNDSTSSTKFVLFVLKSFFFLKKKGDRIFWCNKILHSAITSSSKNLLCAEMMRQKGPGSNLGVWKFFYSWNKLNSGFKSQDEQCKNY